MDDELIRVHAMATRAACTRMTTTRLRALRDSVEHASCLPGKSAWDRRAAAHAEIFILLARMTDDPLLTPVLLSAADDVHHLVLVAGPAANGMIVSSRQRLLAYMRAGDADGAALEMERHLRRVMWVDLRYGEADTQQRVCGDGGCGAGQQAPERAGTVPGQFHLLGDLAEGGLDAVAPLCDDFQQDGRHAGALGPGGRDEYGDAAGGQPGGERLAVEAFVRQQVRRSRPGFQQVYGDLALCCDGLRCGCGQVRSVHQRGHGVP